MYRVLYRKWRPQVFGDVVGQPHITRTLSAEVRENRLAHAYLFTGSRGTGKTTCAKILSKAINCLHPVNGDPCNACEICRGIDNGTLLDIVEIDAASNRGIDDIRVLRDEANFTPSVATYRVYIIDEVHMLTIEAFNALLKTLEEPPAHVKFILATTEVHKLPSTILSRCQRFDFRRIEPSVIAERLSYVASHEGTKLDEDAAMLIARIADGGMRDALSLLDSCISVSSDVTVDVVSSCAGLMGREHIYSLADAVASSDAAKALRLLDELHAASCDTGRLLTELTNLFRNFLIIQTVKDPGSLIVCTDEELSRLRTMSRRFSSEQILYALNVLTSTAAALGRSANRRVDAEMALIRLCAPEHDDNAAALTARIAKLEAELARLQAEGVPQRPAPQTQTAPAPQTRQKAAPAPEPEPEKEAPAPFTPEKEEADFRGFAQEETKPSYANLFGDAGEDDDPLDETSLEALAAAENEPPEDLPPFDPDDAPFPPDEPAPDTSPGGLPFGPDAASSSAPDPDFDFDSFVETYTGKSSETLEAEDESRRAAGEDAVATKEWLKIVLEVERAYPPLGGKFTGSSAYVRGSRLLIRPMSPMIKMTTPPDLLARYVAPVVEARLGKAYQVAFE